MSIPVRAHCPNCGFSFTAHGLIGVGSSSKITLSDVVTDCPRCGSYANVEDGIYGAVGKIVEAARASKGGLDDLRAFHSVAVAVQSGANSFEDASRRVETISFAYVQLWNWINSNGAVLAVVIGILGLCITYYSIVEADTGSDQAHLDALRQLRATQEQTDTEQRNERAQEGLQKVQEQI